MNLSRFLSVILIMLLAGCASQSMQRDAELTRQLIRDELAQAVKDQPQDDIVPPVEVMDALAPSADMGMSGFPSVFIEEPRFDISVANAPAGVFFMSLVADTDINMVVHPSVSGTISLDLKKVTVGEVMALAREVFGYEYSKTENGYIVLPARIQSRIFHVNYLNIDRDGSSLMTVSSGQIANGSNGSSSDSLGSAINNLANAASNTTDANSSVQSSSITTKSKANFWRNLLSTVKAIIGLGHDNERNPDRTGSDTQIQAQGGGRSVVVDQHSGLVVVRAMPGELRDVEAYLTSAQANLQRQVILEAKIIEVQLNDGHQSGIDWAALGTRNGEALVGGLAGIQDGSAPIFEGSSAVAGYDGGDFGNLFALGGVTDNFAVLMRLLNTQGEVQVLSSPRVSTVNNQKAVIKVGSDEFFVTRISTDTTTAVTGVTTTPDITLTPFFSGIALDVTPQISQDDDVILHIHPSVSEVNDQTKNITISGQVQQLPLALSTVRESDSVVKARSGQVIVIGGLMQNRVANDDASVPGVGDIPFLGGLFGQTRKANVRSELVILLKPIVVNSSATWGNYIRQSQQRIEGLRRVPVKDEEQ